MSTDSFISDETAKTFPPIEDYIRNLDNLKKLDFINLSLNEIENEFFNAAIRLPSICAKIYPEDFSNFDFFRVRLIKHIDNSREDLSLIQTFSCPPAIICNNNGRANIKNTSVFYCSNAPNAAMNEVDIKIGDEGFLSTWKLESNRPISFNTLLSNSIPEENEWFKVANRLHSQYSLFNQNADGKVSEHMMFLRKFITELFMLEEYPYGLTSFISNSFLYSDSDIDFLVYPSAKTNHNYVNFAFHPNIINTHLRFNRVYKFVIDDITQSQISFRIKNVGFIKQSQIRWRKSNDEDRALLAKYNKTKI